jgi:hypothetical protein
MRIYPPINPLDTKLKSLLSIHSVWSHHPMWLGQRPHKLNMGEAHNHKHEPVSILAMRMMMRRPNATAATTAIGFSLTLMMDGAHKIPESTGKFKLAEQIVSAQYYGPVR